MVIGTGLGHGADNGNVVSLGTDVVRRRDGSNVDIVLAIYLGLWNDKLGLEKEDLEESVKAGLTGKLVGDE